MYSHLSLIKVKKGDNIKRGQIVAYSGDTGYVTGPHLDFQVFASKAVNVGAIKSKICDRTLSYSLRLFIMKIVPAIYISDPANKMVVKLVHNHSDHPLLFLI